MRRLASTCLVGMPGLPLSTTRTRPMGPEGRSNRSGDEISGLCIFPGASCAGPQECCVLADWADKEETRGHNFNLYLNLGAISLPLVLINCYYRRKAALERGEGEGGFIQLVGNG